MPMSGPGYAPLGPGLVNFAGPSGWTRPGQFTWPQWKGRCLPFHEGFMPYPALQT